MYIRDSGTLFRSLYKKAHGILGSPACGNFIYIYMYIYMCKCICTYICIYVHIHTHTCIHIYIHVYIYMNYSLTVRMDSRAILRLEIGFYIETCLCPILESLYKIHVLWAYHY